MTNNYLDNSDVSGAVRALQSKAVAANSLNNAGAQTLTAAQIKAGILLRLGAAAISDTFPTAALLVASLTNPAVGDVIRLVIRNKNTGTLTLVAGTGNTLEGVTTVAQDYSREYAVRLTNVTVGAEAVTYSGISTAAV